MLRLTIISSWILLFLLAGCYESRTFRFQTVYKGKARTWRSVQRMDSIVYIDEKNDRRVTVNYYRGKHKHGLWAFKSSRHSILDSAHSFHDEYTYQNRWFNRAPFYNLDSCGVYKRGKKVGWWYYFDELTFTKAVFYKKDEKRHFVSEKEWASDSLSKVLGNKIPINGLRYTSKTEFLNSMDTLRKIEIAIYNRMTKGKCGPALKYLDYDENDTVLGVFKNSIEYYKNQ